METIEVYRSRSLVPGHSGWRWRMRAHNGHVLANGGQAYSRRKDMVAAIERVTGLEVAFPSKYTRQGRAASPGNGRWAEVVWVGKIRIEDEDS